MVLIVDSADWVPEQPWHTVRDQSWAEPGDPAPCCWLPPPSITCEWPAPIDRGDAGSEPELWAVGESGATDPITGEEVAVEVQEVLTVAAVLTTVEPVFAELTPFTEGTPFTEFVDGPFDGFTEASVEAEGTAPAEIPPFNSSDSQNDTELSGKPLQISTKPYIFSSEELLPFLTTQPGDPAPEYSAEQSEVPTLATCEPYPFPLGVDFPLPEPLLEELVGVDSTDDPGEGLREADDINEAVADDNSEGTAEYSEEPTHELISDHVSPDVQAAQGEVPADERIDADEPSEIDVCVDFVWNNPEWAACGYYVNPEETAHSINVAFSYDYADIVHTSIATDGPEGAVSGLTLTDTGSSWFIPNYPIKLAPPLPRRGVFHKGGDTVEPEVFPTPDPRVLRGNGELPIADAPIAEESEAPLEPTGPSEDPTYTAYLECLRVNPQWAEDHGAGGIQLQVITPSAHLPWIELSTPGAARAFDTWYSQTLLTQTPPEDQPTDPAAEPWTPELSDFTGSLSPTPEILSGTAVIADTTVTTDAPVTAGPAFIAEPVATPMPARSSGGASLEPLTIQVEPPTLPTNAPTPSATQPEPASALAVAGSTAAFGGDGAPAALAGEAAADELAGLTAAGDAALAGADAALLLEQLRLTALPWWLVRPTRS